MGWAGLGWARRERRLTRHSILSWFTSAHSLSLKQLFPLFVTFRVTIASAQIKQLIRKRCLGEQHDSFTWKMECERNPQPIIFSSYFWFKKRCKGVIKHVKGPFEWRIHTPCCSWSASLQTKHLAWKSLEMTLLSSLCVFVCWRREAVWHSAFFRSRKSLEMTFLPSSLCVFGCWRWVAVQTQLSWDPGRLGWNMWEGRKGIWEIDGEWTREFQEAGCELPSEFSVKFHVQSSLVWFG